MIVTRQLRLGAERASRRLGSSVRLVVRRVAFLLEPGYPHDDPEFVEDHRDRMARKFSAEVGAKGKSRWEDLTPEQREALLRFIRGRKNCGQNAADRSLTARGEDVGIAFREKACPALCPAADAPRGRPRAGPPQHQLRPQPPAREVGRASRGAGQVRGGVRDHQPPAL